MCFVHRSQIKAEIIINRLDTLFMASFDKNVNNYTIDELLTVLDLDESDATTEAIEKTTNDQIYNAYLNRDNDLVLFFQETQTRLLQYIGALNRGENADEYDPDDTQVNSWWDNEHEPQTDETQAAKITDRKQQIDVYNDQHMPMQRKTLGINNSVDVPYAQDSLNPTLKNTINKFVVLDSQFRQLDSSGNETHSTDYTLDTSERMNDVLSMRLYGFQIPFTWYAIDAEYGNTCMWVDIGSIDGGIVLVDVNPGNYTLVDFCTELSAAFVRAGFVGVVVTPYVASGTLTINAYGASYAGGTGTIIDDTMSFVFFDPTATLTCGTKCGGTSTARAINTTLGWIMGFRTQTAKIAEDGNSGQAVVDLYGTRYVTLVIDDFNLNRINTSVITITNQTNRLDIPTYYNATMSHECLYGIGLPIGLKGAALYGTLPAVIPSAPRTLTQAQIYTTNQIIQSRELTQPSRGTAPSIPDTFAVIPIKHSGMKTGDMYVEISGSLQDNKRAYFGPVNIDRLRVRLLDDRGNIVDLHGSEWTVTIIAEMLYQY